MNWRKSVVVLVAFAMISTAYISAGSFHSATSPVSGQIRLHLGAADSSTANAVVPGNIVYSIPVTFYNNQSSSLQRSYDQEVTVNSSFYSIYEAPNLQNVEWFTYFGKVVPSWISANDSSSSGSTVYWLRMPSGIGAHSAVTVYLGFVAKGTNLFSATGNEGVAPTLTQVYGQYDNGAVVFPVYFNGNAPLSSFSLNGLTLARQSVPFGNQTITALNFTGTTYSRLTGWVYNNSYVQSGNFILGASFQTYSQNTVEIDMLDYNSALQSYPTGTGVGLGHELEYYMTTIAAGSWNQTPAFNRTNTGWTFATVTASGLSLTIRAIANSSSPPLTRTFASNFLYGYSKTWAGSFWADYDGQPMTELVNYLYAGIAPPGGVMPHPVFNTTLNATVTVVQNGVGPSGTWYVDYGTHNYSASGNRTLTFPVTYGPVNLSFYSPGYYAIPPTLSINATTTNRTVPVQFSLFPYITAGYVESTLFLGNSSLVPGSPAIAGSLNGTDSLAFSPLSGLVYAAEPQTGSIVYFNRAGSVLGQISLHTVPGNLLYDPANGMLYAAEPFNSSIAVINTTTQAIATTVSLPGNPLSLSLDPFSDSVYASTDSPSAGVVVINASMNSLTSAYLVNMPAPRDIIFDPGSGYTYLIAENATYVGVLENGSSFVKINLPAGYLTHPFAALDPVDSELYVSAFNQPASASVLLKLNVTQNAVAGTVSTVTPNDENFALNPFYDPYNNMLYVSSSRNSGISVLNPDGQIVQKLGTEYSALLPDSMAPGNNGTFLYYPETGTDSVAMISFLSYKVTFTVKNMMVGDEFNVTFNNVTKTSNSSSVSFMTGNGNFSYAAFVVNSTGSVSAGNSTVHVSGTNVAVTLTAQYASITWIQSQVYEAGLPFGQTWTLNVNGHNISQTVKDRSLRNEVSISITTPYITFNYRVSSANYVVVTRQEFMDKYFPGGYSRNDYISSYQDMNVSGTTDFGQFIVFFLPSFYSVTFHETGLAPGTFWDVKAGTFSGVSDSAFLNLSIPNGTFNYALGTTGTTSFENVAITQLYGYTSSSSTGSITMNGRNLTVNIQFTRLGGYYELNITYGGFPTDYVFGATLGNRSEYSLGTLGSGQSSNSIYFMLANGTYNLQLSGVPASSTGLEQDRSYSSTSVSVYGSNTGVTDIFSPGSGNYLVNINLRGLPDGKSLPVNIEGRSAGGSKALDVIQSASHTMVMSLPNGTYSISYQGIQNFSYYYGKQFYWKLTQLTSAGIQFNSSGYMQMTGSVPLNLHFISDYYLKPLNFTVAGKPASVNVRYYREYSINITVKGPEGGYWSSTIGNNTYYSRSHTLTVYAINGTYGYSVAIFSPPVYPTTSRTYYRYSPYGGNLSVAGGNVTVTVTSRELFTLQITGILPKQLRSMEISVGGSIYSLGSGILNVSLANGTYNYSVILPAGFTAQNPNGTVRINGAMSYLDISVSAVPLSQLMGHYIGQYLISVLAGVAGALLLIVPEVLRRRKSAEQKN